MCRRSFEPDRVKTECGGCTTASCVAVMLMLSCPTGWSERMTQAASSWRQPWAGMCRKLLHHAHLALPPSKAICLPIIVDHSNASGL